MHSISRSKGPTPVQRHVLNGLHAYQSDFLLTLWVNLGKEQHRWHDDESIGYLSSRQMQKVLDVSGRSDNPHLR